MTQDFILLTLAVMTCSATGLAVIWTALGKPHWFLRVLVLEGFLALWLIIPAYEILLALFIQAVVAIPALLVVRSLRWRPLARGAGAEAERVATGARRYQFFLQDLLLMMVAVSLILAVAIGAARGSAHAADNVWQSWSRFQALLEILSPALGRLPPPWVVFVLTGLGAGVVTLVAAWVALGQRLLRLRLIALLLIPASALLVVWLVLLRAAGWTRAGKRLPDMRAEEPAGAATRHLALTRTAKVGAVFVSLLIVIPLVVVFYQLATPPPIPPVQLPRPNGHGDLARAGAMLRGVTQPDLDTASPAALRTFVTTHRQVFDTARRGLDRECRVPIEYTADYIQKSLPRIQGFRTLARAFLREGKLAEAEGRTADAAKSYLDTIRLGRAIARGGLLIDALVGWAIEGIGRQGLHDMRETLTSAQCRDLIDALETAAAGWESPETIIVRDTVWGQNAFAWQGRLATMVAAWLQTEADLRKIIQRGDKRTRAQRWLLICEVALQGHCAQHGDFPDHLTDLVPHYLSAVPEDPFSRKPLIYHRKAAGYLLYSVGPDGKDDGGQPLDYVKNLGDILVEETEEVD